MPFPNDQSRISYIDYSRHLQEKAKWSTEEIRRAVVTYQLSVKVQKKVGYIVKQGKKLVVRDGFKGGPCGPGPRAPTFWGPPQNQY